MALMIGREPRLAMRQGCKPTRQAARIAFGDRILVSSCYIRGLTLNYNVRRVKEGNPGCLCWLRLRMLGLTASVETKCVQGRRQVSTLTSELLLIFRVSDFHIIHKTM